jgi:hypothetical protein
MADPPRLSWVDAEPAILARERQAMSESCPDMQWSDSLEWPQGRVGVGWQGLAPAWGAERPKPPGVEALLAGRRLLVRAIYPEGFPMVPPDVYPIDPEVPRDRRTQSRWHVNGDGSLCTVQAAEDWQPTDTAADLIRKASCWFVEYLLIEAGELDRMTERGIFTDTTVDALLAAKYG